MPFRMYNSLMGLAKESLHSEGETPEEEGESSPAVAKGPELVDLGPDTEPEVLNLVGKLREHLQELPKANIATLRYLVRHLRRSVYFKKKKKRHKCHIISKKIESFCFILLPSGLQSSRKTTRWVQVTWGLSSAPP